MRWSFFADGTQQRSLVRLSRLLFAGLILAASAPADSADPLPMPPLAAAERGAYRARDLQSGEELWQAEWTLSQESQEGRPVLYLREDGKDIARRWGRTAWSHEMRLDLWGTHPVLNSTDESRDASGRAVRVQEREFDYATGEGRLVTKEPLKGTEDSRAVAVRPQAITPELVPAVLRLLPESRYHQMRFDVITPDGRTIGMRARILGRERVTVPAGRYDCFKVELEPTGIVGFLAAFKLAKIFMWQTVAAPHFWVKYEGPEGSTGSRQIVRELTRFESEVAAAPVGPSPPAS